MPSQLRLYAQVSQVLIAEATSTKARQDLRAVVHLPASMTRFASSKSVAFQKAEDERAAYAAFELLDAFGLVVGHGRHPRGCPAACQHSTTVTESCKIVGINLGPVLPLIP